MTTTVGFGPLARRDGPPRLKPKYGLVQAADVPNSGVQIIPDADPDGNERWGLGVQLYPFPPGMGDVFVTCGEGSDAGTKEPPDELPDQPTFSPITPWFAERCKSASVNNDQAEYVARAIKAFAAVESAIVEREILTGRRLPANSHLGDGTGDFPNGDAATSPVNGLSILEDAIAARGSGGIIHLSPGLAIVLHNNGLVTDVGGVLKTGIGTTVIPGYGYVGGMTPRDGHPDPTGWEEWAYASGPIDIRRSKVEVLPESLSEALDRSNNTITYIVERHYLVDWDGDIHASVLIDRCTTDCGSAPS